jgi:hypothetical protein
MDMKEKRTTSAAQQGWWVQPESHSRWAEAGEQAGQKQMAMADQRAAMTVRPALTPFGGAILVVWAAKAGQLEAKAAIV